MISMLLSGVLGPEPGDLNHSDDSTALETATIETGFDLVHRLIEL